MNQELLDKINKILRDKTKLEGTGVANLKQLKKLFEELQQNNLKILSKTQLMIEAIEQELKKR